MPLTVNSGTESLVTGDTVPEALRQTYYAEHRAGGTTPELGVVSERKTLLYFIIRYFLLDIQYS